MRPTCRWRRRGSTVWEEEQDGNPRHCSVPLSALMRDERVPLGAALGRCVGASATAGGKVAGPLGQSRARLCPSRGLKRR
jgi:hypothetical protein